MKKEEVFLLKINFTLQLNGALAEYDKSTVVDTKISDKESYYAVHTYKTGIFQNSKITGTFTAVDMSTIDTIDDKHDYLVLINFGMYEDGDHLCGFYSDICGSIDSGHQTSPVSFTEFSCGGTDYARHNNLQMWIPCHQYIYQHFPTYPASAKFCVLAWKRIPKTIQEN